MLPLSRGWLRRSIGLCLLVLFACGAWEIAKGARLAESDKPLTAAEAIRRIDQEVFVELVVKAAKNRLEKRGEIYLDSEEDFHDERNLAIVVLRDGAASLKEKGID